MDFFRRPDRRPTAFEHARVLVPLLGDPEIDTPALKLAALLLAGRVGAEVSLLHVIEVAFDRNLDAEDPAAVSHAEEVLEAAQAILRDKGIATRTSSAQTSSSWGFATRSDSGDNGTRDGPSRTSCATRPRRCGACGPRRRSWHTRHEGDHRWLRSCGSACRV